MYPDGTKVREYADGTIKKVNPDGTVETIKLDNESEDIGLADSNEALWKEWGISLKRAWGYIKKNELLHGQEKV